MIMMISRQKPRDNGADDDNDDIYIDNYDLPADTTWAKVDVGVKDNNGNDALFVAAASGNNIAVAVLLTAGSDVHW